MWVSTVRSLLSLSSPPRRCQHLLSAENAAWPLHQMQQKQVLAARQSKGSAPQQHALPRWIGLQGGGGEASA